MAVVLQGQLNPPQQEAVQHGDGPLLILAGAGSGKTRVITHRIAYLIRACGVLPEHILAVTFTNKAANEMRARLEVIEDISQRAFIGTLHSFCTEVLSDRGKSVGILARHDLVADPHGKLTPPALNEFGFNRGIRLDKRGHTGRDGQASQMGQERFCPGSCHGKLLRRAGK